MVYVSASQWCSVHMLLQKENKHVPDMIFITILDWVQSTVQIEQQSFNAVNVRRS